jgi:hypothetical protein
MGPASRIENVAWMAAYLDNLKKQGASRLAPGKGFPPQSRLRRRVAILFRGIAAAHTAWSGKQGLVATL